MKKFLSVTLALLLASSTAHAQTRPEPTGAVFCTIIAMAAASIAAVMFSPVMRPDDGNTVVGVSMIAVAGSSLGVAINLTVPRQRERTIRVALNGITIHW